MGKTIMIGAWRVEPEKNRLVQGDVIRDIEPSHMRVLLCLVANGGRPVDKADLLTHGWQSAQVSEDNLSVAVSHLRRALDDDLEQPALLVSLGNRGYELNLPVDTEKSEPLRRSRLPRLLLITLLLAAAYLTWRNQTLAPPMPKPAITIDTLAYLPMPSADASPLIRGFDLWLSDQLANLGTLEVRGRASAMRAPDNDADAAAQLGVDAVLRVDLTMTDRQCRLRVKLATPNEPVWSNTWTGPPENLESYGQAMIKALIAVCAAETAPRNPTEPAGDPHFHAYLEGLAFMDAGNPQAAHDRFKELSYRGVDRASVYLKQAQTQLTLTLDDPLVVPKQLPEMQRLLDHALYLDPDLAEAHLMRGTLQFLYEWNFTEAERSFAKALELAPNRVDTHRQMARYAVCNADFEQAVNHHVQRLKQLDPIGYPKDLVAWVFNMSRRFEDALRELALLEQESPDPLTLHGANLRTLENMGRDQQAFDHYRQLFAHLNYSEKELDDVTRMFQERGLKGVNSWLIHNKWENDDVGQFPPPLAVARYCAGADETEDAFYWLQQALDMRQTQLLWIKVDPKYDTLRSDPRFRVLLDRMFPEDRSL